MALEADDDLSMGELLSRYHEEHLCGRCLHAMVCAVAAATTTSGFTDAMVTVSRCGHHVDVSAAIPDV